MAAICLSARYLPHVMPNPTAILQQPGVDEAVGAGKKLLRKLLPR
jgi:hypothetical protein